MSRLQMLLMLGYAAVSGCVGGGDPHHDHSLVLVGQEPKGDNCKYGGTVIHTGIDTNDDGVLGESEITASDYICDASTNVRCIDGSNNVPGPISLRDAADFAAIADAQCIDGDLMIVGSDLAALPPLPSLEIVTGSVIIAGNGELTSLDGLPNIHEVGRKYAVQGNDSLSDIHSIGALTRWQGVAIIGNDALVDVSGLETFNIIEGGIQIANNRNLTSLHGLENLTRGTREGFLIQSNANLTSVAALANLRSATLLEISGNASLTSIPLPSLEKVDVYIAIKENALLSSLTLPTLFTTGGLNVQLNPALADVQAPELVLSGAVTFDSETSLASVSLPKLSYVTSNVDLSNLPVLTQASFPSLVAIGGPLYMYNLPQLPSIGLTGLSAIGGNLTVRKCNSFADFTGLTSLVDVADMTVTENAMLTEFSGLDSFSTVGGDLIISSNPSVQLSTAQAFASSITVVGTVTIK